MSGKLYLYKISQDKVNGWDTYDSAVVVAESIEDAANAYLIAAKNNHKEFFSGVTSNPAASR